MLRVYFIFTILTSERKTVSMNTIVRSEKSLLPVFINADELQWGIIGNGKLIYENVSLLVQHSSGISITIMAEYMGDELKSLVRIHKEVNLLEKEYEFSDLEGVDMLIVDTGNKVLDEKIQSDAKQQNILVYLPAHPVDSDFTLLEKYKPGNKANGEAIKLPGNYRLHTSTEQKWKTLASRFIL